MIALVASAWAGGFEVAQQSAVAGGTGHASTARSDDPAAAWFDPAALADGGGLRVAVGAAVAAATLTARWDEGEAVSDNPLGTPPHLYASYAGGPLVAGIARQHRVRRWGPLAGRQRAAVREPGVEPAVRPDRPVLRRGARAGAARRRDPRRRREPRGPQGDGPRDRGGLGHDLAAGLGHRGRRVGLRPGDGPAVGRAVVQGRTACVSRGEADFDVPAPFAPGLPDQQATADWTLPDRLALGVAWNGETWRTPRGRGPDDVVGERHAGHRLRGPGDERRVPGQRLAEQPRGPRRGRGPVRAGDSRGRARTSTPAEPGDDPRSFVARTVRGSGRRWVRGSRWATTRGSTPTGS